MERLASMGHEGTLRRLRKEDCLELVGCQFGVQKEKRKDEKIKNINKGKGAVKYKSVGAPPPALSGTPCLVVATS